MALFPAFAETKIEKDNKVWIASSQFSINDLQLKEPKRLPNEFNNSKKINIDEDDHDDSQSAYISDHHVDINTIEFIISDKDSEYKKKNIQIDNDIKDIFYIDSKPDTQNIVYDALYSGQIPKYKCYFKDSLHGLKKFDHHLEDNCKTRYYDKYRKKFKVIKHIPNKHHVEPLESCFIELTKINSSFDDPIIIEDPIAKFNKLIALDPYNINNWIQLINYQDEILADKTKLVEVKLSIVEKALLINNHSKLTKELDNNSETHKMDANSFQEKSRKYLNKKTDEIELEERNELLKELSILRLHFLEQIISTQQLIQEWQKFVSLHEDDVTIWRIYLRKISNSFSMFSMDFVQQEASRAIDVLQKHYHTFALADLQMDIFNLLMKSGWTEKCLALMMMQLELAFNCPNVLASLPFLDKIDFLAAFFATNLPRIGEVDAKGWHDWLQHRQQTFIPQHQTLDEEELEINIANGESNISKAWVNLEYSRSLRHWLPWRPSLSIINPNTEGSEEDCEDLQRIVLFEDIQPLIIDVSQWDIMLLMYLLRNVIASCLLHVGIQPQFLNNFDNFLNFSRLEMHSNSDLNDFFICGPHEIFNNYETKTYFQKISKPNFKQVLQFLVNLLTSIENSDWFNIFEQTNVAKYYMKLTIKVWKIEIGLLTCQDSFGDTCARKCEKYLKSLLKQNRQDFVLWLRFAELKKKQGAQDDALKVIDNLISKILNLQSENQSNQNLNIQHEHKPEELKLWDYILARARTLKLQISLRLTFKWKGGKEMGLDEQLCFSTISQCFPELLKSIQSKPIAEDINKSSKIEKLYINQSTSYGSTNINQLASCKCIHTLNSDSVAILKVFRRLEMKVDEFYNCFIQSDSSLMMSLNNDWLLLIMFGDQLTNYLLPFNLMHLLTLDFKKMSEFNDHLLQSLKDKIVTLESSYQKDQHFNQHATKNKNHKFFTLLAVLRHVHLNILLCCIRVKLLAVNNRYLTIASVADLLEEGIHFYPHNKELISIYVHLASQVFINRGRKFFNQSLLLRMHSSSKYSLYFLFHSILLEMLYHAQQEILGTNYQLQILTNRIGSMLSRYTKTFQSPLLFLLYLQHSIDVCDWSLAKNIFYQAVHNFPWCKEIYMLYGDTNSSDLESIVNMMEEKSIRLRLPLQELHLLRRATKLQT